MLSDPAGEDPVQKALAAEEVRGLRLSMRVRLVGLATVAGWFLIENPYPLGVWYLLLALGLAISGSLPLFVERRSLGLGWLYVQAFLDASVVAIGVFVPNPFDDAVLPRQMQLRFSNELYLFTLVALSALSYSPRLVLWTGLVNAAVWSVCVLWVLSLPGTIGDFDVADYVARSMSERLSIIMDPSRVLIGVWGRQMLMLILVAVTLSVAVARSRRLVVQQASAERDRANLSRYFSPKLVDELAQQGAALGETRRRDVVVLFADLAGFTRFASEDTPDRVIELLREYHRRVSHEVFSHDGALDEYLGDGVMATFGNPEASPFDATNAFRCGQEIVKSIEAWSEERAAAGHAPVRVRVGIHRGPVVLGNVGEEQLQFAVVGDAVNVASRLQELAKELEASLVLSDDLRTAVLGEGQVTEEELAGLRDAGEHQLRGRSVLTRVWAR